MIFLVTGGAGFIGGNYLHIMVRKYPNDRFVCLDALTYAGNMETLEPIMKLPNFKFVHGDIRDRDLVYKLFEEENFDYVINFAAESHVDRSIVNPTIFLETNIIGTSVLMDACRKYGIRRYHQVSTDEVYGDAFIDGKKTISNESSPLYPSSPYSASKSCADLLVLSYHKTYGLPITISRSSNNYGPYQYKEKLIPLVISKALNNKKIPIYGDGKQLRNWIYVDDCCKAIDSIIREGKEGSIYNINTKDNISNIDIVKTILDILHKPYSLIEHVSDRLGHDRRYLMDSSRIEKEKL